MIKMLTVMIGAKSEGGINVHVTASIWGWGRRKGMKVILQMFIRPLALFLLKKYDTVLNLDPIRI